MNPELAVIHQHSNHAPSAHPDIIKDHTIPALPYYPEQQEHQRISDKGSVSMERAGERNADTLQVVCHGCGRGSNSGEQRCQARASGEEVELVFVFIAEGAARGGKAPMPMKERARPGVPMPSNPEEHPDFQRSEVFPVGVHQRHGHARVANDAIRSHRGELGPSWEQARVSLLSQCSIPEGRL